MLSRETEQVSAEPKTLPSRHDFTCIESDNIEVNTSITELTVWDNFMCTFTHEQIMAYSYDWPLLNGNMCINVDISYQPRKVECCTDCTCL